MSPLPTGYFSGSRKVESQLEAAKRAQVGDAQAVVEDQDPLKSTALRKASATPPPTPEQALVGVQDQLAAVRAIDPAAETDLLAKLRESKPEYYPLVAQQFRATLAYSRQAAGRDPTGARLADGAGESSDAAATMAQATSALGASRRADQFAAASGERSATTPATELSPTISPAAAAEALLAAATGVRDQREQLAHVAPANPGLSPRAANDGRYAASKRTVRVLPPPAPRAHDEPPAADEEVAVVSDASPTHVATIDAHVAPVSFTPTSPPPRGSGDWNADLAAAIASLEQSVRDQPTTVDELHDHMRLRALLLLAGRDDEAYQPIPGASPAQQDYWAKQLFAIDAYLDGAVGRDDRERAAAALVYLDQARAQLSELATLQLRNLTFVDSVSGFGAYKPLKEALFRPGQHITVYAEVENFRSRADAEGYHTTLGTSYQVLDKSGQRVDGAQFSDVVDVCKNRRRDFHMQYDLPLPERIYAGEYQLELTVTDHTSNKIGVAKLRFEIAGEGRQP